MGRSPCCSKEGLNRGAWTAHEDKVLTDYIRLHGEGKWRNLPKKAGLKRCGKSCRLRWLNYLRPDIKRGNISSDEEELIIRLHNLLGNRWSLIAGRLPGRTDNEIKNYWNTNLGKKVIDFTKQTNTNSSSPPKLNGKRTKTTHNPNPKLTPTAPPFPPKPIPNSNVVRTKATKCSKVLFINSSSPIMQLQNKSEAEAEPLLVDDVANDSSMSNLIMEPCNAFLSSTFPGGEEKDQLSTDLLIDFNVGDICLSELLNSDFSNMCNFSYGENNDPEPLSSSSDHTPWFSEEILKDWTQTSFADETNESNNIHSFTSFLESSDQEMLY